MTMNPPPMIPAGVNLVKFAAGKTLPLSYTPDSLAAAEEKRKKLVRFKRDLFPIEQHDPVENQLGNTLEEVGKLRSQQVISKVFEGRYQILDPSSLDIRDATGMPRLMPFRLSSSEAGFIYRSTESDDDPMSLMDSRQTKVFCGMFPSFPAHITEHYLDVIEMVRRKGRHHEKNASLKASLFARQDVEYKLLTQFGGYIPHEVKREIVLAWSSKLFQDIFIVSEVCNWQENLVVVSVQGDPLVVGYDGYQLWLIAAFDTTTLEEFVKSEFCVKA